jgi:hypothetical protein
LVSLDPQGHDDCTSRNAGALASGWVSLLLALEVSLARWPAPIGMELRALIRTMGRENPLWGAPRIHGELLKLGFAVAQSTVAKYLAKSRGNDPCSQGWATFVRNHAPQIAAMDLFGAPIELKTTEPIWLGSAARRRAQL